MGWKAGALNSRYAAMARETKPEMKSIRAQPSAPPASVPAWPVDVTPISIRAFMVSGTSALRRGEADTRTVAPGCYGFITLTTDALGERLSVSRAPEASGRGRGRSGKTGRHGPSRT